MLRKLAERHGSILSAVADVARKLGQSPAQIELHWAATQPGITSVIMGATNRTRGRVPQTTNRPRRDEALPCANRWVL
jgi:diketogulonate reductase-like aldo/keto reductase